MTEKGANQAIIVRRLGINNLDLMGAMLTIFGEAFDETATYNDARPDDAYFRKLFDNENFVALAAVKATQVVGGLVAYELQKFEQARSEFYIYDLAVQAEHRREAIATTLIDALRKIAAARGASVIFVQADHGDDPAIALYSKLGTREDVMHFDIPIEIAPMESSSH
ncbi:MAG: AAC(3)-I family aminoglycoside N-acetyltransferase [Woeseiaceae bacterium]